MENLFMWFIIFWTIFLITVMFIGGYFMFRKFLKRLPKDDGKSILDWQEFYINETIELWHDEQKNLLNELVEPVPDLFRDVAKGKIAGKISELVYKEKANEITLDYIIRGYIIATPKRDHKFLKKKLTELDIDIKPYQPLFEQSS
ncbi:DUF2621 domain-containing protein [Alkalihalobacillus trypoxylicola]|uniref:DUF2621 domain-containing protein n=1 Tax=Alkalihalobacillus trypoxylicola TaxID=519424 RepID=A0A161Q1P3_9BACI|nr:DUF2621 domain-containing protein [Alkalihalobacillus trypoxylicola]KYG34891.1 hypothetical protein AZF04_00735 [Alkalihalobacillus trypoxylicola]